MNDLRKVGLRSFSICSSVRAPESMNQGIKGCGAGKGGGSGGSIREAGGIFGILEAAREDLYFRGLTNQQLAAIKTQSNKIDQNKKAEELKIEQPAEDKKEATNRGQ